MNNIFSASKRDSFFYTETVFFLPLLPVSHCHLMIQGTRHSRAPALGTLLQIVERRRQHSGVER